MTDGALEDPAVKELNRNSFVPLTVWLSFLHPYGPEHGSKTLEEWEPIFTLLFVFFPSCLPFQQQAKWTTDMDISGQVDMLPH